jgi:hypothetical protein
MARMGRPLRGFDARWHGLERNSGPRHVVKSFQMATKPKLKTTDLDFEQMELLASFADYAVAYPTLSFEQIAQKLGVDFSKVKNGEAWKTECMEVFDRERTRD